MKPKLCKEVYSRLGFTDERLMTSKVTPIRLQKTDQAVSPYSIRVARTEHDLTRAFELIQHSYCAAGLASDSPSGLRLTPYHLSGHSDVLIAEVPDDVVSTISLFGDSDLGLPMESMYGNEVAQLREQGFVLAEIGSFADRRSGVSRFLAVFIEFTRWLAQVARERQIDTLVAAVHPRHARLYQRAFGFQRIGGQTDCPYVNDNPAVAIYLHLDQLDPRIHERVFGLPIDAESLKPCLLDDVVRKRFIRLLNNDSKIADAVGMRNYYHWGTQVDPKITLDIS